MSKNEVLEKNFPLLHNLRRERMTKTKKITLVLLLLLLVLGCFGWIFRVEIFDLLVKEEKSIGVSTNTSKGVPRTSSYLGQIRKAKELIEYQQYSLATLELSAAIREKPKHIDAYLLLGEIYTRTGDLTKLENLTAKLSEEFPTSDEILIFKVRALIVQEDYTSAITFLKNLPTPHAPELDLYHAILLALQNNHTAAKKILDELAALPVEQVKLIPLSQETPSEEGPLLNAEIANKVFGLKKVYDDFERISDGKNPHLFALIAKLLAEHAEGTLAKSFAEVAIKEDIEYIDAWVLRGYASLLMGNHADALQDLRHAYELDPLRPETQYFLALALYEDGQKGEAALFFEKALEHQFDYADEVRWKLVEIYTAQQKYDKVLALYQSLIDENTDQKTFISALNTAINIVKKPDIALQFTGKLIESKPNDVFALNIHAWALIANKKLVKAEEILDQALGLDPLSARTHLNFGLLNEEKNKFNQAVEDYKKAYDLAKDIPEESAIANLAAEKHNELIHREDNPEAPEAPSRPANSP